MKRVNLTAFLICIMQISFAQNKATSSSGKSQEGDKPNILIIMADDVGWFNVGAYNLGMMVPTPNIDRISKEGMIFTDQYAAPSCTAGRAMTITGQLPIRTGLTTVGMAGSPIGLDKRDPTLAEVLKPLGYKTGQFGKNHLGDRNEHLPTVHGFDEFYGNLYHLNTEEESYLDTWPKDAGFDQRYKPRGVLDCVASNTDDATVDSRFGKVGKQTIKDTGPLDPKRMETVDEEFTSRTINFMEKSVKEGKPFFAWFNPSRMHIYTHLREEHKKLAAKYSSEFDIYGSGMIELDNYVGELLKKLEELGIAKNTIVIFTSDNGAMVDWYPDAGTTPFKGEKATTWEGGVRVPMLVRWPARIPAGKISNGIQDHTDIFTTLAAACGVDNIREKLAKENKVYIDGVNNLEHWTGNAESQRNFELYYNEKDLTAIRIGNWKSHMSIREGFFDYNKPSALLINLRQDPFEKHLEWKSREIAMKLGIAWGGQVQDLLAQHFATFEKFPVRQEGGTLKPGSKK
ncbi:MULTISPECIES: arylsulfatase [Flavobacterium]|uniref:arylsulfatase n=1 Tax=Flavobacterium TaxID=237 RepID=UPI0022AC5347|nr:MULTISPECIES: arylsulfatase [Flavobacterium]